MNARSAPYSGTQAVRRALALLKSFSDARPEQSLAELAGATQLHKTTAFRLLSALSAEGLVARVPDSEAYRLGPEAIALGARALRANDLRGLARPFLRELARRTEESCTIETLVEGDVFILDEQHRRESPLPAPSAGTRWPAHATSTGKVLLAALPDAALTARLQAPLVRTARKTIRSLTALRRELRQVRARGYAIAVDELEDGYTAIAAPVQDHDGRVVAALSVGGPGVRLSRERVRALVPAVRQVAAALSGALGNSEPATG